MTATDRLKEPYAWRYAADCIHLHACRRIVKLYSKSGYKKFVARGCNDSCTAYQRRAEEAVVPLWLAEHCVTSLAANLAYGYSEDDEIPLAIDALEDAAKVMEVLGYDSDR